MSNYSKQTNWAQFIPLVTVFFFWGFVAASNDILIPVFQKAFHLTQTESMLVQICFYVAYTVGSLIYMIISKGLQQDLINKIGYKNGLILGLLISAAGTLLFYPAANLGSFPLMISGLFIVGLGFSLQQIVANPLAIEVGPKETGSQRLTMAGGINNLGTTIGPLIVAFAIFGSASAANTEASIESVKIPYLILGVAFVLVAIMLKFSSLPTVTPTNTEDTDDATPGEHRSSAFQYPQLVMGMIAIFVYVGVEVSTASNLPAYMEKNLGFETKDVAPYVSLYWASLMIGRWTGAVEAFDVNAGFKKILRFLAPYLAFGVFLLVNAIAKHDLSPFYVYGFVIIAMIICDIMSKGNPARMLLIFSVAGIAALLIGMFTTGMVSVYAFTSVGLFCSTLWPCIFALAINGLGKHTNQGSGYLIMMIMGGGIVSLIQGYVADITNIHFSYIIGVICFAYLAFYAIRVTGILKAQGINLDQISKGDGH
ncbi:sugar MFS transporter [Chryseobacterium indologenes]|uniref:MFS transporter n=1 Tax=Chryseobacterium indologenes TaxID=253 RepID=A0A5R9PPK1_CHRID|nr:MULTISPECIES: sugar MFS transporter [Chryseobacterium]AZB19563.1 MFS transporter [Chryseobacterium indologenes]QPQ53779.1 sugar MFS transporter [Chryseobacterium indologenes]TLX24510.1 sugar MFS transporter [Chryseobacterium indologenes]SFK39634.1 MFS transporter, FHS family, L-fucose permease [Chryseobacterium indologenes]SUX52677.1 L-fucose permease [Chryseobacterium indologenes]